MNRMNDFLIITLFAHLTVESIAEMSQQILGDLEERYSRFALFDLSAVKLMDTDDYSALISLSRRAELMGVTPVMAGFKPELAAALATLGAHSHGIAIYANVEIAIAELQA